MPSPYGPNQLLHHPARSHDHSRSSQRGPSVGSDDPDFLLVFAAKSKLGGREQPVDDQQVAIGTVIDDLRLAVRPNHEQRRQLALDDAGGEFDIDLAAVVKDIDW